MFNKFRSYFRRAKADYVHDFFSPDRRTTLTIQIKNGNFLYSVHKDEKVVVRPSRLGMLLRGQPAIFSHLTLVRTQEKRFDETWEAPWGEQHLIRNNYQEVAFYLSEATGLERLFTLRFRIFNEGFAFRYEIPPQPKFQRATISSEMTEFNVNRNAYAWNIPAYQPDRYEYNYRKAPIYDQKTPSIRHLPLRTKPAVSFFLFMRPPSMITAK